jgi:SAM-dependent methyltransferase
MRSTYASPDLVYHEGSFARQASDFTVPMLQRAAVSTSARVLDVGCGAGQTLRVVDGMNRSAVLIGVDPDARALEHGQSAGKRIWFLRGAGERLPIADGSADLVICRVAINYMHQGQALSELARVAAPRGRILVSFIAPGYSLREVVLPGQKGFCQRVGNFKDLVAGLVLQVTGLQPRRSTFWGRSVPYTSQSRLRRQLRAVSFRVAWLRHEGTFLGLPTVSWALLERDGDPAA